MTDVTSGIAPLSAGRRDGIAAKQARQTELPRAEIAPKTPETSALISRRRFLRRSFAGAACALGGATYARMIEPFWLDEHEVALPLRNLPPSFAGFRMIQLTDLHAADNLPIEYLQHVADRVNALAPDYVVLTGDLVTHAMKWVGPVCDALARIKAPMAVSLGNHDYNSMHDGRTSINDIAHAIEARLGQHGIPVLRNRALPIAHADGRIWLVGLDDLWCGQFSPQVAFAAVNTAEPVIALSHNPDTAPALDGFGAQWTLSGHTHGGQIRLPFYGALMLNVHHREFQSGEIQLPHSRLYVSRGVGYLKRVRFNCRPELPCFVMQPARA